MFDVSRIENVASEDVRRLVSKAHRRILDAIEAKDAETARRRAERDVHASGRHLEASLKATGTTLDEATV
jgi:DNA-binding GntR family transcriptional regulator